MKLKWIIVACLMLLTIPHVAMSVPYSFNFDLGGDVNDNDLVHYNSSFTFNTNQSTTAYEWFIISAIALLFLILTLHVSIRNGSEEIVPVFATLATGASFISALTSNAVEIVTSSGVTSIIENVRTVTNTTTNTAGPVTSSNASALANNTQEFVSMSAHTIYNFNLVGLFMWLVFVISVLALIRHFVVMAEFKRQNNMGGRNGRR